MAGGAKGKAGGTPGAGGDSKTEKRTLADMALEEWSSLPLRDRSIMDALPNERFLPRYEKLLKRYYSTINEKSK